MQSFVQLHDLEARSVVADFAREDDAWEALAKLAYEHGSETLKDLGLLRFENGEPSLIAMGEDLVRRALDRMGRANFDRALSPTRSEVA